MSCERESDIKQIHQDIAEIKTDVKNLLKFKWQIIGGFSVALFLVASTVQILGVIK